MSRGRAPNARLVLPPSPLLSGVQFRISWSCSGAANQVWRPTGGTLVNPATGKCLDDPASNTANGTQLIIFTCNGGANQRWALP